ncbi:MAG: pitrilysin family protein [Spirochaetota bacterium]
MKKYFIIILTIILAINAELKLSKAHAQSKSITIDNIALPSVKSSKIKNGLRVFYIKDELPRVIIILSAGYGKLYENNKNAGISDLLAKTLSLAGSKKYPADVLHNTIENIGGRFAVESSFEETVISIQVLEKYSDTAFDILHDIITNPNLDAKIIENARSLLLEDVRRKKDNPDMLAFEKAREIIFNGTGYGASATEESLKSVSKDDLGNIFQKYFTAKNIIIGIAGSADYSDIEKNLEKFKSLNAGEAIAYTFALNEAMASLKDKSKNIYLLPKDIPQATIVAGTIAPDIKDARIYAMSLMNDILGGSDFNSRLMQEIRVKRGLAYAVQSVLRHRKNTGVFLAYAQTKNETADTALSLLLENIEQMAGSTVKKEELQLAKDSVKNSYIFEFDTSINILRKYSFLSYNGLGESFYLDYVKNTESVSTGEIQKCASQLFGSGLVKVVIGSKDLEKKLGRFGKVIIIKE